MSAEEHLEFDRSWQDAFGTVLASVERGSRQRSVMVIGSSELGRILLEALGARPTVRGRLILAILEELHAAPLEAVLRDQEPDVVIALEQTQTGPSTDGPATHGPAIHGTPSFERASTGLEYIEPGSYPAWQNPAPISGAAIASVIASVASDRGLRCLVCNPSTLGAALEAAWQK
jgi:hypothetical protein